VVENGTAVICSDYKRHARIKRGLKLDYGEENQEEGQEVELLEHPKPEKYQDGGAFGIGVARRGSIDWKKASTAI